MASVYSLKSLWNAARSGFASATHQSNLHSLAASHSEGDRGRISRAWHVCRTHHSLRFERLESRRLLVAEGDVFTLNRSFEAAGLAGTPTAVVQWGDGTQSPATVTGGTATGNLRLRFDYSLDSSGFFSAPERRSALEAAGSIVVGRLTDSLSAIQPSGNNTWSAVTFHPSTGAQVTFPNPVIAANEIVVYAGARDLGPGQLGLGGPGGTSSRGTVEWNNTVLARGQSGALTTPATDFGPWGGSLTFNNSTNWYFGFDPAGLQRSQQDFITVATHELTHLIGFGTSPSWTALITPAPSTDTSTPRTFAGPNARATHDGGGNPPVNFDGVDTTTGRGVYGHFPESLTDAGRKSLMGPLIEAGRRDTLTPLDLAVLDDIGWDVASTSASLTAQHVYGDNGTFPITITYQGSTAGSFTESLTANITNVNPTLRVTGSLTGIENQPLQIINLGEISDPGFGTETFTYAINWGDGTAVDQGTATLDRQGAANVPTLASFDGSHTYATAGVYNVTVTATDDDNGTAQQSFQITVAATPSLSLSLNRTSISETAGSQAATLTIQRSTAATSATTINLASDDPSEATVPATATIPAGQLSVTVPVSAVDDTLFDGSQTVTLTATSPGLTAGSTVLTVTDVESLAATFTAATISENAPPGTFFLTVRRSNTDTAEPLAVTIAGNVPSQLTVPAVVTIPAGSQEVRIPIEPVNDDQAERPLPLSFTISAAGYTAANANLTLADDEPAKFQNRIDRFNVDGRGDVVPLDALRIINLLSQRRGNFALDPTADDFAGIFPDVNGDYMLTALDALLVINEISRRRREGISGEDLSGPVEERDPLATDLALSELAEHRLF